MHTTTFSNRAINKYRLITQQCEQNSLQENNICAQIHIAMKNVMGDRSKPTFNIEK